ncbi:SCO0607 family lipoprotein [Spirilliplanes yamanashiensis]|nr:hypothetical protein [Spirilliplanes yamanashiensis]MDP9815272.1 hypothetical protein [Spirilliplanes yamanashiensis]
MRRNGWAGTALRWAAAAAVVTAATGAVAGCLGPDAICRSGEYPVKAVGNTTGAACVPDGEEPPAGYVRYPAGKEPRHVDDKWDRYWRTVVVDGNGAVVSEG